MIWRDAERFFAPEQFGAYAERDVITLAISIGRAGVSTVGPSVRNALYMLLTDPALQADLRAGGMRAVRTFDDEALRLYGPVDVRPRLARRDTEVSGVQIAAGDLVLGLRVAANRDGRKFECPGEAILDRPSPKNHFSFYKGRRSCPGQGLARTVMEEIITTLLERLSDLELDRDAEPPRFTGLVLRRWQPLNAIITFAA